MAAGQLRPDEARRVQVVAFDLEDGASIRAALSGVGKVRGGRGKVVKTDKVKQGMCDGRSWEDARSEREYRQVRQVGCWGPSDGHPMPGAA